MVMQADLRATRTEARLRVAPLDDCRVRDPAERLALLVELRDRGTPVLMHAPDGHALRTTLSVVDAAAARLAFALSAAESSAPYLSPLLDADDVTAIAHPGPVKLQFELTGLVLVRGQASVVLQSALPEEMLRIQRRESFRVTPPVSAPVAYLRHPAIPDMSLALRVLDLSLGGCALRLPDDVPPLSPGTHIAGVTIELDVNTRLRADLTLQHLTHLSSGGSPGQMSSARVGCEWRLARVEDERALQRWIDQAQVRQRLRQRSTIAEAGASEGTDVPVLTVQLLDTPGDPGAAGTAGAAGSGGPAGAPVPPAG
ncbi:MAG: flagellar brake protein [Rubrivivax sp.]|nr:flagellar brake protein [Rubrivivax sp.]